MKITTSCGTIAFVPWIPAMEKALGSRFAFRGMTTPPDAARPWLASAYLAGAACDGERGLIVSREHLGAFFEAHAGVPFVVDAVAAQLDAVAVAAPGLDIYRWVDGHLVEDVSILERLHLLATEGHAGQDPARPDTRFGTSPARCARPGARRPGRIGPGVDQATLRALADGVVALRARHRRIRAEVRLYLAVEAPAAWGFVSPDWLREQARLWGLLTLHIQVKAAIVLRAISARGLHLDLGRRAGLLAGLDAAVAELRAVLHGLGFIPGQPSSARALRWILGRIDRRRGGGLMRTANGDFATSEEALGPLAAEEPFVEAWLAHGAASRLRDVFARLGGRVVHPSFDVLMATGRASSYGEINAQALPRDERVRSCFVARPGCALVVADYKAIEMVTLAQSCLTQFGLDSRLAAALNAGRDPHAMVASLATGKPEGDLADRERDRAKPINFGLPGLMGPSGLKAYARSSYGLDLDDDQVAALTDAWFAAFPETRDFLREESGPGADAAIALDLTPASYTHHAGRPWACASPGEPSAILGGMLLKVLGNPVPATQGGRPYDDLELDYFWGRARDLVGDLPPDLGDALAGRKPSSRLRKATLDLLDSRTVLTLTGRSRSGASSPARHNNVFQGLAADGAKLALWEVWRAGYAIVNFVHDELVVEVPYGPGLDGHAREIRRLMVAGMRRVIPDVAVRVECSTSADWGRSGRTELLDRPDPRPGAVPGGPHPRKSASRSSPPTRPLSPDHGDPDYHAAGRPPSPARRPEERET